MADASEDLIPDHKLSGYLCAVLVVNSPHLRAIESLAPQTRCSIFSEGCDVVGFKTENGLVLLPPATASSGNALIDCASSYQQDNALTRQCSVLPQNLEQNSPADSGETSRMALANFKSTPASSSKRNRRRIGLVNGSPSVIHQLHALVTHKCLSIVAFVVSVAVSESGETRVVVLVDIYLRSAVWLGWQFPNSRSVAGSLFSHLSCDWIERNAILSAEKYSHSCIQGNKSIWNLGECHVLRCKIHSVLPDFSKKKLFDLHEIFKSLPGVGKRGSLDSTILQPMGETASGISELSDDILVIILTALSPLDLIRVAATCRHLRSLAMAVIPCMKLELFPHQQAAVEWMLKREKSSEILPHPLYKNFITVDGFAFAVNSVSGEIFAGAAPTIKDFSGGMFCDEPGLGKTITALSLILKTQGKLADPPDGANVIWCSHYGNQRCGYYEQSADTTAGSILGRASHSVRLGESSCTDHLVQSPPKRAKLMIPDEEPVGCSDSVEKIMTSVKSAGSRSLTQCTRSLNRIKKNLLPAYGEASVSTTETVPGQDSYQMEYTAEVNRQGFEENKCASYSGTSQSQSTCRSASSLSTITESWVQCDACHKWRKISREDLSNASAAWFCSMNTDPAYQSCGIREERVDDHLPITELPGFCLKGTSGGERKNVAFFSNILTKHFPLSSQTKKALTWLAKLSPEKLSQMETAGLRSPCDVSIIHAAGFRTIFKSFGLVRKVEQAVCKWYYPRRIENLAFDVVALRISLSEPLSSVIYLSRATLIVVPANLIDHWKTQIQKHIRLSQLRVYVLNSGRQISPHILAWDYDVVITTFNRFSAEWSLHKKSVLQQVHWLRIILDEGHTLGSSLGLTNKLNLAISLKASSRWVLTGTPTPNTPNSELSNLQIMFKFLHEEVYGQNQKSWETGIIRPFEAELEEGRIRLFDILSRCMISARKKDLKAIPSCTKQVKLINFTEEHARSYNELVVTVRRNILMADWNDPSHVESLLNPKQWKFRSTTIRNVRLSCCVAGHIKVAEAGQDIQETMDILCGQGLVPHQEEYALIQYKLLHGGSCARCEEWCRLPVITPCRHLLCLDCVALDSQRCAAPGCSYLYEMQTPECRPENPNPKWPVPKDLIELQPSYKQDDWDPDWQSTSSSKVSYLVERLNELTGAKKRMFSVDNGEQLYSSDLINLKKASLSADDGHSRCEGKPEKVIIFSQFLEHIHVIEQQLSFAGIKFVGMYSPMHFNNKMKSLETFQSDPTCTALLMDGSAALGLDLSFVSHVFLMEPIWDKSMEEQVISRAHRMGATRPIHVETLAMCGTIEQQMVELLQDSDSCRGFFRRDVFGNPPELEGGVRPGANRSLHDFAGSNYLARLKCVQTKAH